MAAGEQVGTRAAQHLGRGDAEVAIGPELGKGLVGPPLLVVHSLRQRIQLRAREAIRLPEQFEFRFGKAAEHLARSTRTHTRPSLD
jgi:hypothetical protein